MMEAAGVAETFVSVKVEDVWDQSEEVWPPADPLEQAGEDLLPRYISLPKTFSIESVKMRLKIELN
jgi:hypothetical protein